MTLFIAHINQQICANLQHAPVHIYNVCGFLFEEHAWKTTWLEWFPLSLSGVDYASHSFEKAPKAVLKHKLTSKAPHFWWDIRIGKGLLFYGMNFTFILQSPKEPPPTSMNVKLLQSPMSMKSSVNACTSVMQVTHQTHKGLLRCTDNVCTHQLMMSFRMRVQCGTCTLRCKITI